MSNSLTRTQAPFGVQIGRVCLGARSIFLIGAGVSLIASGFVLSTAEGVSPFLHLSACLGGQPLPNGATPAAHCGWCWSALAFLALAIAWPPTQRTDNR